MGSQSGNFTPFCKLFLAEKFGWKVYFTFLEVQESIKIVLFFSAAARPAQKRPNAVCLSPV
jgi:hypothetical protein